MFAIQLTPLFNDRKKTRKVVLGGVQKIIDLPRFIDLPQFYDLPRFIDLLQN